MPWGRRGDEVLGLHLPDALVVEGHVEVHVRVVDQAVVGDDGNAGAVRGLDDDGRRLAVVRRDEQDVHALRQHVLGLRVLQGVVAVGRLDEDLRAELARPS